MTASAPPTSAINIVRVDNTRHDDIAATLDHLESAPPGSVHRFDHGPQFRGRVAFLPSAYNPPTIAHLHLIETALGVEDVETTAAVLTTRNVAKGVYGASLAHRVGMLLALRDDYPALAVLAANSARILDQVTALESACPTASFVPILGFDTLVRLFDPRYYNDMEGELAAFFTTHRVIATNRGGLSGRDVDAWLETHAARFRAAIIIRELGAYPASLSSTNVRESIRGGYQPTDVAPAVLDYIEQHALYRDASGDF